MKRILILNGGYSEIPLIHAAKQNGFYVIVTGNNRMSPGNSLADEYIPCDYSDMDAVYHLAEEQRVEAICSGCNDLAYISAAYACEKLGLPGHDSYETALELHHKNNFREFMRKNQLPVPKVVVCREDGDFKKVSSLHFPVIVKPVDLFGGIGMKKCYSEDEVGQAIQNARRESKMPAVLVEEFLTGTNHGFTTIIQNKKVVFYMADKEYHEYSPFAVSAASVPVNISEQVIVSLKAQIEVMAEKLDLCDGLIHVQFILIEKQKPVILEVCRRGPGDLYIEFVKYATGFDYPDIILSFEAGLDVGAIQQREVSGYWVRYVLACTRAGIINKIDLNRKLAPYIKATAIHYETGKEILQGQIYKAGVVFFKFSNQEEMEIFMREMPCLIEYR